MKFDIKRTASAGSQKLEDGRKNSTIFLNFDLRSSVKKKFIETKVAAIKLQGFNQ
jgi:hypothetical protein